MLIGLAVAVILAFLLGLALKVSPDAVEIASRTKVGLGDVVLALCAGAAGALSFTGGTPSALVGVMVAVALLPPLAACGLLAAVGNWTMAAGSGLLFLANLVCINLSGVVVFRIQGYKPGEKEQTRAAILNTFLALAFWSALLALLIWFIMKRGDLAS